MTISKFDWREDKFLELSSNIHVHTIDEEVSKSFDYTFSGKSEVKVRVPHLPAQYQIGLIVGPSGSGKSSILSRLSKEESPVWDNQRSVASHFESVEDVIDKLGASGLNSIPTWLRPYHVLSTGEKFRADLARKIKSGAVIDEFTSVVDRNVAKSASVAISKYIRFNNLTNITLASCHYDIIEWLEPDWVYDTETQLLTVGRLQRRPQIQLDIMACSVQAWNLFRPYHYLNSSIHNSSTCYLASWGHQPVAFMSLMHMTGRDVISAWREHRLVVLPDFQGMGIGNKLSEVIGQRYIDIGKRYYSKTSNPRMGEHRNKSLLWRATANNMKSRPSYLKEGEARGQKGFGISKELQLAHSIRVCYSHEYIGASF